MPLPLLSSLLSPRLQAGDTERTVWDGFNFQSNIYNTLFRSSPGEKEWFLAEFYVRLKEKQSKTWLIGTLGYGLIFKKWDWREKLFVTLRTHKGWPCLLCAWLLGR